jgi:phosphonate transport system ATP-binding protein
VSTIGAAAPLEVRALTCGYNRNAAIIHNVELTVAQGQTVVLAGPSGSGKTTLLKTVLGLIPPLAGELAIFGSHGRPRSPRAGYIPQSLGLVRHVTALRNTLMGTLHMGGRTGNLIGRFSAQQVTQAHASLEKVGLAHKARARTATLSGGERRRVAVARAVAQRPRLLLADEILSELDERTKHSVLSAVRELQGQTGMGILMVEHDLATSCEVADLLLCVRDGRIVKTLEPSPDRHRLARQVIGA